MTDEKDPADTLSLGSDGGRRCENCGSQLEDFWTFCGRCGCAVDPVDAAALTKTGDAAEPASSGPRTTSIPSPSSRRKSRITRLVPGSKAVRFAVAGLVILAATAAVGWVKQMQTSEELNQRTEDLRTTSAALASTRADLASTTTKLEGTESDLLSRETELKKTITDLNKAKGSLSGAQSRLNLQAGQITTLKLCLAGVQRALSYVAYDDYGSALSELEEVETACRKANDTL